MKTYIKHILSLLLIFGLTVTECSIFNYTNYSNPSPVSYVDDRVVASRKRSDVYVYKQVFLLGSILAIASLAYRKLRDVCSTQTQLLLKLRTALYQQIDAIIAQVTFLSERTSSNTHYTLLYIA